VEPVELDEPEDAVDVDEAGLESEDDEDVDVELAGFEDEAGLLLDDEPRLSLR
jgi:hypothetical protein